MIIIIQFEPQRSLFLPERYDYIPLKGIAAGEVAAWLTHWDGSSL